MRKQSSMRVNKPERCWRGDMRALELDLEPFKIDSRGGVNAGKRSSCCAACSSKAKVDKREAALINLGQEAELRYLRRRSRRSAGRRPRRRNLRYTSPRGWRSPRPRLRRLPSNRVRRPTPKPWPPKHIKRPIVIRPRWNHPVVVREPSTPCTCPAHGTEFVR